MRHYPVFLDLRDRRVVVSGAGEVAVAKLRLLMKTEARDRGLRRAIRRPKCGPGRREGRLALVERPLEPATPPARRWSTAPTAMPTRTPGRPRSAGRRARWSTSSTTSTDSDFITPAIVDRDPVTVAIGTEGAAPVLARKIKAEVEAMLPATLGRLDPDRPGVPRPGRGARFARRGARSGPASISSAGRARWTRARTRRATSSSGCWPRATRRRAGFVHLVGAGPGDPELLTLKARRLLHEADVVIHDRLVPAAILELARREATIVEVGKKGYGPSWKQDDINALMVADAARRRHRGAAEGRRPGGLRPARRGDRGARGGGRALRRSCRASPRPAPARRRSASR